MRFFHRKELFNNEEYGIVWQRSATKGYITFKRTLTPWYRTSFRQVEYFARLPPVQEPSIKQKNTRPGHSTF